MALTLRESIMAALESCSSNGLDSDEERELVLERVMQSIRATTDAHLIRQAFAHAATGGECLIVTRGLGGRREAEVLVAACRLAGLEVAS